MDISRIKTFTSVIPKTHGMLIYKNKSILLVIQLRKWNIFFSKFMNELNKYFMYLLFMYY